MGQLAVASPRMTDAYALRMTVCCSGKDLTWYAKDKGDMGVSQEELEAVKAREREMMAEVCNWLAGPKQGVEQLEPCHSSRIASGDHAVPQTAAASSSSTAACKCMHTILGVAAAHAD